MNLFRLRSLWDDHLKLAHGGRWLVDFRYWLKTWPEVQNDRHEMSGLTCRRHVGQHVTNIVQTRVGEGIDMTHPNVGFCDMSANVSKKSTLSTIFNILESISTQQSNIAMRRCCWGMATAWGHLGRRVGQPLKVAVAAEDQRRGGWCRRLGMVQAWVGQKRFNSYI